MTDLNKIITESYMKRMANNGNLNKKKPKVENCLAAKSFEPRATFDQLHGCDQARERVFKIVDRFKRSIDNKERNISLPILISGSKGLGKTSLVEAAANYACLEIIPLFLRKMSRKGKLEFQTSIEQFSAYCSENQPAIILMDDLDKLNGKEDKIDIILDLLDRLTESNQNLLVFCTTSSILDENLTNSLEFIKSIQLKRPDLKSRFNILSELAKKCDNLSTLTEESLREIALNTPSFTPADLDRMFDSARIESSGSKVGLQHCHLAIEEIKQSFKRGTHLIGERPETTWNDIAGMDDVREAFKEIMSGVRSGDVDCKFAGIALYGPPGCGKTMVAKAMANEAGLNFISIGPSELQDKFYGETERNIRRVFREAEEFEPCVIYFDEFDGLCGTRGSEKNMTNAIQTLLSEMDGFAKRGKSIILVSTNRLNDIDPAMRRAGRLSEHIRIKLPDEGARRDILNLLLKRYKLTLANDIDLNEWVKKTKNFSGADLTLLIHKAKPKGAAASGDLNTMLELKKLEDVFKKIRKQKHLNYNK